MMYSGKTDLDESKGSSSDEGRMLTTKLKGGHNPHEVGESIFLIYYTLYDIQLYVWIIKPNKLILEIKHLAISSTLP